MCVSTPFLDINVVSDVLTQAKAEAGKGYKEAHQELDDLFRDLSGYVGGPMPLDMRTSIDNLARCVYASSYEQTVITFG